MGLQHLQAPYINSHNKIVLNISCLVFKSRHLAMYCHSLCQPRGQQQNSVMKSTVTLLKFVRPNYIYSYVRVYIHT